MIHGGDHDYDDLGMEGEGVVSNLSCIDCRCYVEVYKDMSEKGQRSPEEIREAGLERFNALYREKWDRGQEEHGGCLDKTVTIEKAEEECIDLWAYLQSLRQLHNDQLKELESVKNEEIKVWRKKYEEACHS